MDRVRLLNERPLREGAKYALYWMQANCRVRSNHALAFAAEFANDHNLPLLVYEELSCDYPYASDRFHTFVMQAVPETARELRKLRAGYVFHLHRRRADAADAFRRLASSAAAIIRDDYPVPSADRDQNFVSREIGCACYAVDSSCIVPMNRLTKREWAAYTLRPKIRKLLPQYLTPVPAVRLRRCFNVSLPGLDTEVSQADIPSLAASCEIDHGVAPSPSFRGGAEAAERQLSRFLKERLRRYARERNEPSAHATSELSPYLHFGHLSALEVALRTRQFAEEHKLIADEFLEEIIVRRELAFNFTRFTPACHTLEALPAWALQTLRKHQTDPRPHVCTRREFAEAATHDALWNATQKELLLRGKIHGYYRMYWGKKIIEWSATPEDALDTMIDLHDRYALDGRDPNTYTNILWCFGLHDRPWGERPVFGTVRYLSLEGMKRKTNVEAYIREIEELERTGQDPFRVS